MIEVVDAREILDSRGNPTVEVDVVLADGSVGRAAVPSGASTGVHEAVELRDGDKARFGGKGVAQGGRQRDRHDRPGDLRPGRHPTRPASTRSCASSTARPTSAASAPTRSSGVSLACAHAAAASYDLPLYRYLGGVGARIAAGPVLQHPQRRQARRPNSTDFQEFMVAPVGVDTFAEALRAGAEVFAALRGDPPRRRARDRPGRRGRLRAVAADERGRRRGHPARDRARRLPAGRGRRASRSTRRRARSWSRGPASRASPASTAWSARAGRSIPAGSSTCGSAGSPTLPDHLARGRARPRTTGPAGAS